MVTKAESRALQWLKKDPTKAKVYTSLSPKDKKKLLKSLSSSGLW